MNKKLIEGRDCIVQVLPFENQRNKERNRIEDLLTDSFISTTYLLTFE